MRTPRLEINLDKLTHNATELAELFSSKGISITAVTKGVCGAPLVAKALVAAGIHSLGDSRIANIRKMRDAGVDAQLMLLCLPKLSEIKQVVDLADVSLNSEISTIRGLAKYAAQRGVCHGIILMVELGDLREGLLPSDVERIAGQTLSLQGVKLLGIGTNLACFGGIRPTETKMNELSAIAQRIERQFNIHLTVVSGGNSANYRWFMSAPETGRVNHLRIGEAILLGRETLTRKPIPGLCADAFTLVAEVLELQTKPSRPYGERAQDAFGRVPVFQDKGPIRRAILALGEQDIDPTAIEPCIDVDVLGASSDHLILDARQCALEVGAEVKFDVQYSALLRAMTAPYVHKLYLGSNGVDLQ